MRITNSMIVKGFMHNLHSSMRRLDTLHQQLSSGKRLQLPSDDPAAVAFSMRLRSGLNEIDQYSNNVADGLSWLQATESALFDATEVLQRARELAVYGASGVVPSDAQQALADEIDQLLQQLVVLANSGHDGRYLFSGQQTLTPAYANQPAMAMGLPDYDGDFGELRYEISPGVEIAINVPAEPVFRPGMEVLLAIRDALTAGNSGEISAQRLAEMDQAIEGVLRWRAELGARMNRLDWTHARLRDLSINTARLLSDTEDLEMARAIIDLKTSEDVYRAALASGARLIQPTLMDFLR